jgi:Holliday junction resolvasome RuvABC endonuclease subunit
MLILGVDPGRTTGWALLEVGRAIDGARVVRAGLFRFDEDEQPEAWVPSRDAPELWAAAVESDVLAVESPDRCHVRAASGGVTPSMVAGLLLAKGLACVLSAVYPARAMHCPAETWRKVIVGRANASDAQIAAALARLCRAGLLAMPSRTNAHVRDAIGVALWAAKGGRR